MGKTGEITTKYNAGPKYTDLLKTNLDHEFPYMLFSCPVLIIVPTLPWLRTKTALLSPSQDAAQKQCQPVLRSYILASHFPFLYGHSLVLLIGTRSDKTADFGRNARLAYNAGHVVVLETAKLGGLSNLQHAYSMNAFGPLPQRLLRQRSFPRTTRKLTQSLLRNVACNVTHLLHLSRPPSRVD